MEYRNLQEVIKNEINNITQKLNINKGILGDKTGIQKSTLYSIYNNKRDFTLHHLYLISKYTNIPIYQLLSKDELISKDEIEALLAQAREHNNDFTLVPQIPAVACGNLTHITDNEIEEYKSFSKKFLKNIYKPIVTTASGDSMFPTIMEKDLILLNRDPDKRANPNPNKIYLLDLQTDGESSLTLKRVELQKEEWKLTIIPDNRSYPIETIQMLKNKNLYDYILAEVAWIGREFKE